MATTKPRATQIRGLASQQAPFLADLIPDSYLPNNTGDFRLIGAFFTPDMNVIVEGQTVNRIKFISDNEVLVNLTTGAAEGTFDVTLNNGIQAIFQDVLLIVLGEVFTPITADWNILEGIPNTETDGKVEITTFDEYVKLRWNQVIDQTKDWSIRFKFKRSPLGDINSSVRINNVILKKQADLTPIYYAQFQAEGSLANVYGITPTDGLKKFSSTSSSSGAVYNMLESLNIDVQYIGGVLRCYINNTLRGTFNQIIDDNLFIDVELKRFDLTGIKYIELAT